MRDRTASTIVHVRGWLIVCSTCCCTFDVCIVCAILLKCVMIVEGDLEISCSLVVLPVMAEPCTHSPVITKAGETLALGSR